MTQAENPQETVSQDQSAASETSDSQWEDDPLELLDIPLNFPYSTEEWDAIFDVFIDLCGHPDIRIWNQAVDRLIRALEVEAKQDTDDYDSVPTDERMWGVFEAIAQQTLINTKLFTTFCARCKFIARKSSLKTLFLEWLNQLTAETDRQTPEQAEILAAQIFFGAYDLTWQEVGNQLVEWLDHENLNVRACAADQIVQFYCKAGKVKYRIQDWDDDSEQYERDQQAIMSLPPFQDMQDLMRQKEIERPGVAGDFWFRAIQSSLDGDEWLLDVLERSPHSSSYSPYFPCTLAFHAHEHFSRNPAAIRRLIDMGRIGLALETATDESKKIAELQPLLIELGHHDDPEVARIASWHLAYYYHYLHPHGVELGYVEQIELSDVDLFLLFSRYQEPESPYAVVIYPQAPHQHFHLENARRWINQIFPKSVRGDAEREDWPDAYPGAHISYQRGYIHCQLSSYDPFSDYIDHATIGYRSKVLWDPKQFL